MGALATSSARAWEPPEEVGGFRVLAPLGQGGMGKVYLARDTHLDRLVALKFMVAPEDCPSARERFRAEAQALARLHHPNVVDVWRIDEAPDGHPFIAYEYVRGESLDHVLMPVRWQTALAITSRLASALRAAHAAKLLHRDVKPSNVMLTPAGDVKLLDFGLAISTTAEEAPRDEATRRELHREARAELDSGRRLTAPGLAVGTPRYWAPEQWRGAPVTAATDIYQVGLLAHEMLVGRLPHEHLAGPELAEALASAEVPPVERSLGPRPLLEVVGRCLRREPRERYASGAELAAALEPVELVFLTPDRSELRIGSDEDLVAASWGRVASSRLALADRVYAHLFASAPEVHALFPKDLTAQKAKLMHVLDLTVRGLHHPEQLAPMLRELGRRHVGYGVDARHLQVFGRALRQALAEQDPGWSEALDAAWEHAFGFVVASMRAGMLEPESTVAAPISTPPPRSPAPPSHAEPPRTAYAQVDRASVAYHVFGKGPPDVVLLPSMLTHVEATWAHPSPVALLTGLARFARVVLFDPRGCGLSDPLDGPPSTDAVVADILGVMAGTRTARAVVVAAGEMALPALRLSATHPDAVAGLVLFGAAARFSAGPDYPRGKPQEFWDDLERWLGEHWGEPILAELLAPSACRDPSFKAWFASYFRLASSPRRAVERVRWMRDSDERASLSRIAAPTLVLHRRGDLAVPSASARELAAAIPGARAVVLEGDDHFVFAGDGAALARQIERFVAGLGQTEVSSSAPDAPR